MQQEKTNRRSARSIQIFQVSGNLASILIGIILVKYIDTEQIGKYEMVLMGSLLIGSFIFQGFIQSFLSDVSLEDEVLQKKQVFNFFVILTISLWFILCLIGVFQEYLLPLLFRINQLEWLNDYLLYTGLILPSQLLVYLFMLHHKSTIILFYSALFMVIKVGVFLVPLMMDLNLSTCIRWLMYSGALFFVFSLSYLPNFWKPVLDNRIIRRFAALAVPLVAYALLGMLPQYVDAWIVNWFYQESELFAVFRYGAKELPFIGALTAGISAMALPVLTQNFETGIRFLKEETGKLIKWLLPFCLLIILFAPYLFTKVYSAEFEMSGYLFSLLLLTIIPRILFAQTIIIHLRKSKLLLLVSIIELCLNAILSLILINYFGLVGVLLATVLAFLFEKTALIVWLKNQGIEIGDFIPIKPMVIFFFASISLWIIVFWYNNPALI